MGKYSPSLLNLLIFDTVTISNNNLLQPIIFYITHGPRGWNWPIEHLNLDRNILKEK